MVELGFTFLGLSETLSIVAIFVAGLLTVPGVFLLWEALELRRAMRGDWRDEFVHPDGPLTGGVVLADYVDEQGLISIRRTEGPRSAPEK